MEKLEEEDQIGGPVETSLGIHIIQLARINRVRFEAVEDNLRELLKNQKPSVIDRKNFKESLRREARIEK